MYTQDDFTQKFNQIEGLLREAGKSSTVQVENEEESYAYWPDTIPLEQRQSEREYSRALGLEGPGEFIAGTYGYELDERTQDEAGKYMAQLNAILHNLENGDFRTHRERVEDRLEEQGWRRLTVPSTDPHTIMMWGYTEDKLAVQVEVGLDVYFWPITVKTTWIDNTAGPARYDTWGSFNRIYWGDTTPDTMASCLELSRDGQAKARGFGYHKEEG